MPENFSGSKLLNFYKQFYALLSAGLPIPKALRILELRGMIIDLEKGQPLFAAFARAGFPAGDINLIKIGEESGRLLDSLGRIIKQLEGSIASRNSVKKALMYPMVVLSLSFCSIIFLLVFILPTFKGIFSEFNFELPFLTRLFLGISEQWFFILIFTAVLAAGFCFLFKKEEFRINLPLAGSIYKNTMLSGICRSLGYQLKSGVPVLTAIATIREGLGSRIYSDALAEASLALERGEKMSEAIKKGSVFPDSLIQIIGVGEESGSLDEVLVQSAGFYEQEAEGFIKKWVSLIEPAATLVVGGLVGLIAFSMILPLFQMMEQIQ